MGSAFPRDEALVEISERLRVMRKQEATHYAVPDYLAAAWQQRLRDAAPADDDDAGGGDGPSAPTPAPSDPSNPRGASRASSSPQITEAWREKICEWCYQVVDHFDFDREVVSVAVSYLDRYLAARAVNRRIFQLAAMTALHLAVKLFEPRKLRLSSLIDLSRGNFLAAHVVAMEDAMLWSLRWRVHPPTPLAFCRDFGELLGRDWSPGARHDVGELSRFLAELSVCDYWFATKRPSSVALASIVTAVELRGRGRVDDRHKVELLHRVGIDIDNDAEIVECYERLREMYLAGDYQAGSGLEGGEEGHHARGETESPVGVEDGPDAQGEEDAMECA